MKETVDYIVSEANKGFQEYIDRVGELNSEIAAEQEKYFELREQIENAEA